MALVNINPSHRRAGAWLLASALLLLPGACGDAVDAKSLDPIAVSVVSGNNQTGAVGIELPAPLVVRVTRSARKGESGVPDALVNFRVIEGLGTVFAGSALTDRDGMAREYWTLSHLAGRNVVEVRAVDPTTGEKLVYGRFEAIGVVPGPETCNGLDDNLDGTIDDASWQYCIGGHPAPNTDGMNACTTGYLDIDLVRSNGCEVHVNGTWNLDRTLTLVCPGIPGFLGDISVSHLFMTVRSPTEVLLTVPWQFAGNSAQNATVALPLTPGSPAFHVDGVFPRVDQPITGGILSTSGSMSLNGGFTGSASLAANLHLALQISFSGFPLSFDGNCQDLDTSFTATHTDP